LTGFFSGAVGYLLLPTTSATRLPVKAEAQAGDTNGNKTARSAAVQNVFASDLNGSTVFPPA
jgi:hypothetical protein